MQGLYMNERHQKGMLMRKKLATIDGLAIIGETE
jgi:hypothetical protein